MYIHHTHCSISLRVCAFAEKLKLHRDFSEYNYLSLDSASVNGLDDAANFRTVRVSSSRFAGVTLQSQLMFEGSSEEVGLGKCYWQ